MFEHLEQRRLLVLPVSGSVIDLDDSPDVSFVTGGNDVIEIILSGGNIQVRNGAGTVIDQRSASGITAPHGAISAEPPLEAAPLVMTSKMS